MKPLLISLISAVWVLALTTMPLPAAANAFIDTEASCSQNLAEFNAFQVGENHKRVDGKPYVYSIGKRPKTYPGVYTNIFACTVAGHSVRINFLTDSFGSGPCGGQPYGFVSVWFDGVKVVNRAQYNWYPSCRADPEREKRVSRILINNRLHMTICYVDDWFGQAAIKPECVLTDLSGTRPDLSSLYYGPVRFTKPALLLVEGKPKICTATTHQLNSPAPLGGVLERLPEIPVATLSPEVKLSAPYKTSDTAIDVDNDGVTDVLTFNSTDHYDTGWQWRSGQTGKTYGLTNLSGRWNNQLRLSDYFRFVRLGKRIYALRIEYDDYIDPIARAGIGFRYQDNGEAPKPQITHALRTAQ
ncbi:hypothetical protein [Asticcacaulis taihuensis]|uniref:hypothetical protein n=1 Tax=Asticcacaulis taihuensis TaxID=260084 RepID=UPI003F7C7404